MEEVLYKEKVTSSSLVGTTMKLGGFFRETMKNLLIRNNFDERGYNTTSEVLQILPTPSKIYTRQNSDPRRMDGRRKHLQQWCERIKPDAILSMGLPSGSEGQKST